MKKMTTVLIVDDEYLVRRGIRETVDWQSYGFEIIGEAVNGIDGYEKYLQLKPDIIVTDVKMNKMTGLEFVEKLKLLDSFDSDIIIISAYDEFEYVKKALENNVSAYILKPIRENELISAMLRIKSERKSRREHKVLVDDMVSQMPLIKNTFLKELLEGKYEDIEEIKHKCSMYKIDIPQGEYTVACIKVDNLSSTAENTISLQNDLDEALAYCRELPNSIHFESCTLEKCYMALIIFHHDDNYKLLQSSTSILIDFFSTIAEHTETVTGRTISIGYSMGHREMTEIGTAFDEAKRALAHKSFVGNNSIIDYITVPKTMNSALIFSNDDIEKLLQFIKDKKEDKANKLLDDFFDKVKKDPSIDIESLKDVVLEMSVMVLRKYFKNVDEINDVYGRRVVPSNELMRLENIYMVEEWTRSVIGKIFEKPAELNSNRYILRIKEQISEKYNQAITAESIADELHISSYYMMHLFKEEVGMTFNQYLTNVRIEKAVEMLKTGEYKVYEVAEKVGYKDATYFSYIFKKVTGKTPKEIAFNK